MGGDEVVQVGGFIGESPAPPLNCYSIGFVEGAYDVGGFVGWTDDDTPSLFETNFFDKETSGTEESGIGLGLTTLEMQTPSTYEDWNPFLWVFEEGEYPKLFWEIF